MIIFSINSKCSFYKQRYLTFINTYVCVNNLIIEYNKKNHLNIDNIRIF